MNHLSLFSGIGGPDLAAEWMGWNNIAHTEWNPFGRRVLNYYWPEAASHHDITKTDYTIYRGRVDILTGGFPCQGFSLAGKRMGTDDDRYLWPEMRRAYRECQPRIIIGENDTGLLSMEDKSGVYRDVFPKVEGRTIVRTLEADHYEAVYTRQAKMLIDTICKDLEEDGYEVQPFVIPAAAVGAPHKRDRVFIIAYAKGYRNSGRLRQLEVENGSFRKSKKHRENHNKFSHDGSQRPTAYSHGNGHRCNNRVEQIGCPSGESQSIGKQRQRVRGNVGRNGAAKNAANANRGKRSQRRMHKAEPEATKRYVGVRGTWPRRGTWQNFPTQSPVCDGNDGLSAGLDTETVFEGFAKPLSYSKWRNESIKAGGNAIVPQVMYQIFKGIEAVDKQIMNVEF